MDELKHWSRSEIVRMREEMDRLFDDLCTDFDLPVMMCRISGDLDIREVGDTLIARLELGNMSPEDVEVAVLDRRLIIAAKSVEIVEGHKKSHTFRKEVKLPCVIRTDDVEAQFADGVLEVCLPKCPSQQGQKVTIIRK